MSGIITATLVIGGIGLFIGLFLGISAIKFSVEVDEKEIEVLNALPGNNCGGCGYPGCSGLASAIAKGNAPVNACPVGGDAVAKKVATIMGVTAATGVKTVAYVRCQGSQDKTTMDYEYSGVEDCRMMPFVPNGGPKSCNYGCLGYGSCVKECQFDAIHIVNKIAVVDKEKCKACKKCIAICPKKLITLIPYDATSVVTCMSKDKGPVTTKGCTVGCIGCGICKKNCPVSAITVEENLATINQDICIKCGLCKEKCPKKTILV